MLKYKNTIHLIINSSFSTILGRILGTLYLTFFGQRELWQLSKITFTCGILNFREMSSSQELGDRVKICQLLAYHVCTTRSFFSFSGQLFPDSSWENSIALKTDFSVCQTCSEKIPLHWRQISLYARLVVRKFHCTEDRFLCMPDL